MKIKYPKKKKRAEITISTKYWWYAALFVLATGAFLAGMLFYRSGYASRILTKAKDILQQEPVTKAVDEIAKEIDTEIKLFQVNGLPNLFLDIPFSSMMAMEEKREAALVIGVLHSSDDDYVPATIRHNRDQTLDIKLRLKGDWVDHLRSDKWSFRIHITEEDGAILGMRRFSLQAPHTRSFASEWGYHQTLFQEGILAPRYTFVNIIINGKYKGIYALEESFTGDLVEAQERREGIIFRLNEDLLWHDWTNFLDVENHADSKIGRFWLVDNPASNEINPYRGKRIARNATLSEELTAAKDLLYSFNHNFLSSDQVLDEELWGKYFAITDLWAGGHGVDWINNKFYYNPITSLIEPIAFDGFVFHPSFTREEPAFPFSGSPLFNNPGVQKAYIETLERIATPQYIEGLQENFSETLEAYYDLLVEEYKDEDYEEYRKFTGPPLKLPWDDLNHRADLLSRNLNPKQPLRGYYRLVKRDGKLFLRADLINLMVVPVQIREVALGEVTLTFDKAWCFSQTCQPKIITNVEEPVLISGRKTDFIPAPFYIPLDNLDPTKIITEKNISLRVNLYGGSQIFDIPLSASYAPQGLEAGIKPSTTVEETLAKHPFLTLAAENQLAILPGDWEVTGDLLIPEGYNLTIPEGTTLRFETKSVFLSYGSVDIIGSNENPVLLTAKGNHWGGMVVLEAPATSTIKHAKIEKMAGIPYPGWVLTGGITFYQSAVDISYTKIGNNTTEDALNVIQTTFAMNVVEFMNTSSDAFDGDFVSGKVTHCHFHDIMGDGFDTSGSRVEVRDSLFTQINDKAISAGEGSELTLHNLTIRDVNIGIASKDKSTVLADEILIESANIVGLAVYIKKPQYGPAILEATNVELVNTETSALCQTDNKLLLNGESIPTQDFDVGDLYDQGILGN